MEYSGHSELRRTSQIANLRHSRVPLCATVQTATRARAGASLRSADSLSVVSPTGSRQSVDGVGALMDFPASQITTNAYGSPLLPNKPGPNARLDAMIRPVSFQLLNESAQLSILSLVWFRLVFWRDPTASGAVLIDYLNHPSRRSSPAAFCFSHGATARQQRKNP